MMQKEIKVIDEAKQILRVTTMLERWYFKPGEDIKTGLPTFKYYPSSTWIAQCYPKGLPYWRWLADKGWDQSQAIMIEAGNRGTKVHKLTEDIEKGEEIDIRTAKYSDSEGKEDFLTPDEIEAGQSFIRFFDLVKPQVLATEMTIFGKNWAGTLDSIWRVPQNVKVGYNCTIQKGIWIIDKKTSKDIWPSHKIQLASYSHADIDYKALGITDKEWAERKLGILQLGNKRTKEGYKFTPIEDKFELFKHAYAIWEEENPEAKPKQRDLPLILKAEHNGR